VIKFSFFSGWMLELITNRGSHAMQFTNPVNIQEPMIDSVVKYFRGQGENPCSLEEALTVMKMIDSTN
jgi:1,5-anhydro-D-fructose reductase (1,5-anhydro-D-mannitol-forming)